MGRCPALGAVMLRLEEETEGRGIQDKEEKWGGAAPPTPPVSWRD